MERNSMFIELPCWSDIYAEHDFIIILCAGQESSVIDFVNYQNAHIKVKMEIT